MVGGGVADLVVEDVVGLAGPVRAIGLEEVVEDEAQVVARVGQLARLLIGAGELGDAPAEHGRAVRHGQAELHPVAGVEPAAGEVDADVAAVAERRRLPPRYPPGVLRQMGARALRLVEAQRLGQRVAVVELQQLRWQGERRGGEASGEEGGGGDAAREHAPQMRRSIAFVATPLADCSGRGTVQSGIAKEAA